MSTIESNLYPPLMMADIMPSFIRDQTCRVYFSLSIYNNIQDILETNGVQVSLLNQSTNASALQYSKYPSGIMLTTLHEDTSKDQTDDYRYYIEIKSSNTFANSDLESGIFEINQYYILQLRFVSKDVPTAPPSTGVGIAAWLNDNMKYFSEWSQICLLKGIEKPIIQTNLDLNLMGTSSTQYYPVSLVAGDVITFSKKDGSIFPTNNTLRCGICNANKGVTNWINLKNGRTSVSYTIPSGRVIKYLKWKNVPSNDIMVNIGTSAFSYKSYSQSIFSIFDTFVGSLSFADTREKEYLKSYNIKIQEVLSGITVFQSEEQYTNAYTPNQFNYEIPYDFKRGTSYLVKFTYTTNGLYTDSLERILVISDAQSFSLDVVLNIYPDKDHGRIVLDMDFENAQNVKYDLVIRRASSRTNFSTFEKLAVIPNSDTNSRALRYTWYDDSIESGVYYKYRVQENRENGKYQENVQPIICLFEDIFLTGGSRQLKIQFNPSISDIRYNTMESQQTTLGSYYPYIRRNGNNFFRSFSISGLISALMDDTNWYNIDFEDERFHYIHEYEPFTSKEEIYGDSQKLYEEFNDENNIDIYQDYIYQREFRKKVMDFLYSNDTKLFRSLTEGNILVKLMNVAFQPVETLGRRLYSFSATAVEVDQLNSANSKKYKVLNRNYHGFKKGRYSLNDKFKGYQSIIDTIKSTNSAIERIYRMDIRTTLANTIVWVKPEKNDQPVKYVTNGYYLSLSNENDKYFIEDAWFCGAALQPNQYVDTGLYYSKTSEVISPVKNGVYEIANLDEAFKIDDYISYNNRVRKLLTTEDEVGLRNDLTWFLFVKQFYTKWIYYNNKWYPFSENNEVLIPLKATIDYYYEEKGETK